MKKWALLVGLLLMMVWATGCVVIDVDKVHSRKPASVVSPEVTIVEQNT